MEARGRESGPGASELGWWQLKQNGEELVAMDRNDKLELHSRNGAHGEETKRTSKSKLGGPGAQ